MHIRPELLDHQGLVAARALSVGGVHRVQIDGVHRRHVGHGLVVGFVVQFGQGECSLRIGKPGMKIGYLGVVGGKVGGLYVRHRVHLHRVGRGGGVMVYSTLTLCVTVSLTFLISKPLSTVVRLANSL